jgi:hypothetical protein
MPGIKRGDIIKSFFIDWPNKKFNPFWRDDLKSESTTTQALAFKVSAASKMVRKALPFPGIPW